MSQTRSFSESEICRQIVEAADLYDPTKDVRKRSVNVFSPSGIVWDSDEYFRSLILRRPGESNVRMVFGQLAHAMFQAERADTWEAEKTFRLFVPMKVKSHFLADNKYVELGPGGETGFWFLTHLDFFRKADDIIKVDVVEDLKTSIKFNNGHGSKNGIHVSASNKKQVALYGLAVALGNNTLEWCGDDLKVRVGSDLVSFRDLFERHPVKVVLDKKIYVTPWSEVEFGQRVLGVLSSFKEEKDTIRSRRLLDFVRLLWNERVEVSDDELVEYVGQIISDGVRLFGRIDSWALDCESLGLAYFPKPVVQDDPPEIEW